MTRLFTCSALALSAIIVVADAQDSSTPIPFVASVKRNATGTGGLIRIRPGDISVSGMPVRILIRQAYGQLQDFQLVGGPARVSSDRFDIELKLEDTSVPPGPQFVPNVLRQLLEDRFKLKTHKRDSVQEFTSSQFASSQFTTPVHRSNS